LIEKNRSRDPDIDFRVADVQELDEGRQFAVISSVMVLQHIPWEEQAAVCAKLGRLLVPGGFVILIEALSYDFPQFFPRAVPEWLALFEQEGFGVADWRPLNYQPFTRMVRRARPGAGATSAPTTSDPEPPPSRSPARSLVQVVRRATRGADQLLQPALIALRPKLHATHSGFLFVKPLR
jgi:SAM-dependent methyltransferase